MISYLPSCLYQVQLGPHIKTVVGSLPGSSPFHILVLTLRCKVLGYGLPVIAEKCYKRMYKLFRKRTNFDTSQREVRLCTTSHKGLSLRCQSFGFQRIYSLFKLKLYNTVQ